MSREPSSGGAVEVLPERRVLGQGAPGALETGGDPCHHLRGLALQVGGQRAAEATGHVLDQAREGRALQQLLLGGLEASGERRVGAQAPGQRGEGLGEPHA